MMSEKISEEVKTCINEIVGMDAYVIRTKESSQELWGPIIQQALTSARNDAERECAELMDRVFDLENDLKDFNVVIRHCSIIYDHASGGIISKPMTDPHVVIDMLDDRITKDCEEARNDALESAAKECEGEGEKYWADGISWSVAQDCIARIRKLKTEGE